MSPWTHVPSVLIFISLVLLSTMIYSFYQTSIFGRGSLTVSFKDNRGITCGIILSQSNGNLPQLFQQRLFLLALPISCPPQHASCSAIPTVPPSLLSPPCCIVETTSSLSAVTQEFPHKSKTPPGFKWQTTNTSRFRFSIQEGCRI